MSLLHYAALWGHIDTCMALIESGAEIGAPDDQVSEERRWLQRHCASDLENASRNE